MKYVCKTIVAIALILFSGCSLTNLETPEVTLTDIQFSSISLFETGLVADVRFLNPNEVDLRVVRGKHKLLLNGVDIGNGYHEGAFTIRAYSSVVEPVTFRISNIGLVTKMERLIAANDLAYKVTSDIKTDHGSFDVVSDGRVTGSKR